VQSNPTQAAILYRTAIGLAHLDGTETLWDLYSGVGTIGLFFAPYVNKVIGIEDCLPAVNDANLNMKLNGILNAQFICGKSEEVLSRHMQSGEYSNGNNVVILNPPRKGCHPSLLKEISEKSIITVIYISCNPKTLSRDLDILIGCGYVVNKIIPVDMFPYISHVEVVVHLCRAR
jgi:23S rRNA (uracil1939-C5)-methyltransferase